MEFLFEILFELFFDGVIEGSKSRRIPKVVRYSLIALVILLYLAVIGLVVFTGVLALKENLFLGLFFILLGVFIFLACIIQFRKVYLKKTNKK